MHCNRGKNPYGTFVMLQWIHHIITQQKSVWDTLSLIQTTDKKGKT